MTFWMRFCLIVLAFSMSASADEPSQGLLNKLLAPGPLIEGHKNLEQIGCLSCHSVGQGISDSKCLECHKEFKAQLERPDAFHGKKIQNKKCFSCHQDHKGRMLDSTQVDPKTFDHELAGYSLKGKHKKVKCEECHLEKRGAFKGASGEKKTFRLDEPRYMGLKQACVVCHKKQDPHFFVADSRGKFAEKDCDACHGPVSWKQDVRFNHDKDTKYKLLGKHANLGMPEGAPAGASALLKCNKCHAPSLEVGEKPTAEKLIYRWSGLDPASEQKKCGVCHNSKSGREADKGHKTFSPRFAARDCSDCHSEKTWKRFDDSLELFDHQRETAFALTGKHLKTTCRDCHWPKVTDSEADPSERKEVFRFLPTPENPDPKAKKFCLSCHVNVHEKQFGKKFRDKTCTECHTAVDFKKRLEFDHDTTAYRLLGKHLPPLKCEKCHIQTVAPSEILLPLKKPRIGAKFQFPELATQNCQGCHKDPHKAEFGPRCTDCHQESDWKKTRQFHARFTLSGVHYSLACAQCHRDSRNLGGMSQNCVLCHQKDDVHAGSLPKCDSCHRQQVWEMTTFRHSLGNFPLRGVHRTLDCYACHKNGVYKGVPKRCVDCHLNDATSVAFPPHVPLLTARNCAECHNQFSFR